MNDACTLGAESGTIKQLPWGLHCKDGSGTVLRCEWAEKSAMERDYHDREWGVPVHDDRLLFEFLILEGVQAGLSWATVLAKRENYRRAFDGFDPRRIASYDERKVADLLQDAGIIRNRLKIRAAIANASAFLEVQADFGSFDSYIWSLAGGATLHNAWHSLREIPANTPVSDGMSKALRQRGFTFVGSTICYAFMQAVGMVNDHTVDCFRYQQLRRVKR